LALLDPLSLEELKATGRCDIKLPEALFNLDYPGHYYRRVKSVSISIPGIAGPNTNINATLSMQSYNIRTSEVPERTYDPILPTGSTAQSAYSESIATSSAQNDSGVFELNFKDERYVPFEGKGAVSKWSLELSDAYRQFDYSTIADVVMHMKYTARDGGSTLASAAKGELKGMLNDIKQGLGETGVHYAISLRHDMPNEWNTFKQSGNVNITLLKSRLPYFVQALNPVITDVNLLVDTDYSSPITNRDINFKAIPANTLAKETMALIANTNLYSKALQGPGVVLGTALTLAQDTTTGTGLAAVNCKDIVIIAKINVS
jgi:Tc toxin complex TcA C-terminal TcB-binding domain